MDGKITDKLEVADKQYSPQAILLATVCDKEELGNLEKRLLAQQGSDA